MKKTYIYGAVGILVVVLGITFALAGKKTPTTAAAKTNSAKKVASTKEVRACDVITKDLAEKLLGIGAQYGDTSAGNTSSDDTSLTSCTYTSPQGTATADTKSVSFLARIGKTDIGIASNRKMFDTLPAGAIKVDGYGESAFWNQQYGQFNIFKNGNWYILTYGNFKADNRTVDEGKALADAVVDKL